MFVMSLLFSNSAKTWTVYAIKWRWSSFHFKQMPINVPIKFQVYNGRYNILCSWWLKHEIGNMSHQTAIFIACNPMFQKLNNAPVGVSFIYFLFTCFKHQWCNFEHVDNHIKELDCRKFIYKRTMIIKRYFLGSRKVSYYVGLAMQPRQRFESRLTDPAPRAIRVRTDWPSPAGDLSLDSLTPPHHQF